MKSQEKVWNNIAKEWYEFKNHPPAYTIEFLKNQTGKILDLGSGSGRNLLKIKSSGTKFQTSSKNKTKNGRMGKMYLVDFSKEMIKFAKEKAKEKNIDAEFFVSDLTELPFENNFFNSAICISALHCIQGKENRTKVVKELFRVLKKTSKAEIGVWNFNSKRFKNSKKEKMINWRDKGKRYYYLFEEKEVHDLFKEIGFKIISTHNSEMMINFIVEK